MVCKSGGTPEAAPSSANPTLDFFKKNDIPIKCKLHHSRQISLYHTSTHTIMAPAEKSSRTPTTVHEYTVLPLTLPATTALPKTTKHHLYLRSNAPKVPTDDTPREVFAVNLPIDASETHMRSLFAEQLGGARIEKVEFEGTRTGAGRKVTAPVAPKVGKKRKRGPDGGGENGEVLLPETWDREVRRSGSTAVVTFVDVASADMALKETRKASKAGKEVVWGKGVEEKLPALGSASMLSELHTRRGRTHTTYANNIVTGYLAHHTLRYPSASTLQSNVDAYMIHFAAQEAARAQVMARQRAVPDEDGFITVTRGGRVGPARHEEAQDKADKQKEKSVGKEDFYRFQIREHRKERAGDLLRGFEEDRRRVDEMKQRRNKFRPN